MDAKFFVPFETAKALQIKGYPNKDGEMRYSTGGDLHRKWLYMTDIVAPTYHEAVDWLDSKGIYITTSYLYFENITEPWICFIDRKGKEGAYAGEFPTREEALNAAILKALEMI